MNIETKHREILALAVPSIVTNITVPLLGLADVTIMGHVGDARFIAAIAVGTMVFNIVYWLFGFLRMGTTGLTAQAFGAGDKAEQQRLLHQGLAIALGIAALILLLQVPLRELALLLMRPTTHVRALAYAYYNICVWGAPAMLGLYSLTGWYIGMQDTRTPMVIAISQNVLNIVLSVLLVFGFGMKIEGVALGTVVAQWTGFLMAVVMLPSGSIRLGKGIMADISGSLGNKNTLQFFAINRDIFMRTLFLVAVNLFFTSAGAAQGAVVLSVNTLLMQLFMLFSYVMDGFAYAGEALSGRYYGAADSGGLKGVIRRLFRWGTAMVAVFTLTYAVGGQGFLGLLTSDVTVLDASRQYFFWALLIPVAGVAAFIWDGVFVGLTLARGMFVSSAVAAMVFFAVYFFLVKPLGNHALWLAFVVYLILRGVVQTVWYSRWQRKQAG